MEGHSEYANIGRINAVLTISPSDSEVLRFMIRSQSTKWQNGLHGLSNVMGLFNAKHIQKRPKGREMLWPAASLASRPWPVVCLDCPCALGSWPKMGCMRELKPALNPHTGDLRKYTAPQTKSENRKEKNFKWKHYFSYQICLPEFK